MAQCEAPEDQQYAKTMCDEGRIAIGRCDVPDSGSFDNSHVTYTVVTEGIVRITFPEQAGFWSDNGIEVYLSPWPNSNLEGLSWNNEELLQGEGKAADGISYGFGFAGGELSINFDGSWVEKFRKGGELQIIDFHR